MNYVVGQDGHADAASALAGLRGTSSALGDKLPNVGFKADTGPIRSECSVGALMRWADAFWAVTYNSHTKTTGTGLGLYRIDEELKSERVHVHDGTHANRFIHKQSNQCFIGPYAIGLGGEWKFTPEFANHRLTSTMKHLTDRQTT